MKENVQSAAVAGRSCHADCRFT